MKKLIILTTLILISMISFSCNEKIEYLEDPVAIVYQDDIPYLINLDKETFSLAAYDSIVDEFGDFIIAQKNDKYGILRNTGEETSQFIFDKIFPIRENKAVAIEDNTYLIIDYKGNILYTFEEGIYSNSYFSQDNLVITDGNMYGYLYYDGKEFTNYGLNYDYALPFVNDYAIIGKYESAIYKENYKYNYYTLGHAELFDEFKFDFADNFYDGYARVANYGDATVYYWGSQKKDTINTLIYSYVDDEGEYLTYSLHKRASYYVYEFTPRYDREGNQRGYSSAMVLKTFNINYNEIIAEPYASNFHDGMAVVGSLYYYSYSNTYYKGFRFIDTYGLMEYTEHINNSRTCKISFDTCYEKINETLKNVESFQPMYGSNIVDLAKVDDILTFRVCITGNESNWQYYYGELDDYDNGFNEVSSFEHYFEQETLDSGEVVTYYPDWLTKYAKEYYSNAINMSYAYSSAINDINIPYETTNITTTEYLGKLQVSKIRIFKWNTYGILAFESYEKANGTKGIKSYFLFDPIYDKIIF